MRPEPASPEESPRTSPERTTEPRVPSPEAEKTFAGFLSRRKSESDSVFESYVAKHPGMEDELRGLYADWKRVAELLDRLTESSDGGDSPSDGGTHSHISVARLERLAGARSSTSQFEDSEEIARGAMGVIYKIFDEDLRRSLAMKVIATKREFLGDEEQVSIDPRRASRFLEEAQITGQLEHPGIVPVHQLGLDRHGRIFFTMRLVRGSEFTGVIRKVHDGDEDWPLVRALGVLQRVCEAVAFAHTKKVIHRDLKPSNVMVGRFGETYVMDWGLAKIVGSDDQHDIRVDDAPSVSLVHTDRQDDTATNPESPLVTMDGDVVGTPAYMSPEQARGQVAAVDQRSDVYSVGAMMYHLLANERSYVGKGERVSPHTVLNAVRAGPPRPLHEIDPSIPPELQAICDKAMAREQEDRYPDMLAMAADVRSFLEGRVVAAFETGAAAEFKKWVVRNKGLAAAAVVALFAVIAGLGSTAYVQSEGKQRESDLRLLAEENEQLARDHELVARDEAARADAEAKRARDALAEVEAHLDLPYMEELVRRQNEYWPLTSSIVPSLEAWLDEARPILQRARRNEASLQVLRERALPYSDEMRSADRDGQLYVAFVLESLQARVEFLEQFLASPEAERGLVGVDPLAPTAITPEEELDKLRARVVERERELNERLTYEFEVGKDQKDHAFLVNLIDEADSFTETVEWVESRLAVARSIEDQTIYGAGARSRWEEAGDEVARSPRYAGLRLEPQAGLLPLGPDPDTGLWEFWHAASGSEPTRDPATGGLVLGPEAGVVLVLVPGGDFLMGSSPGHTSGPNRDPWHVGYEAPVIELQLEPFFLSKFEMTRGQWKRVMGSDPSRVPGGAEPDIRPVGDVGWADCTKGLARVGLVLPTEAQWEYSCRGGTDTPFHTGSEPVSLIGYENVADAGWKEHNSDPNAEFDSFEDGFRDVAPVGALRPNPLGLFDMHGNVSEWCRDTFHTHLGDPPHAPGTGFRGGASPQRTHRGGSWNNASRMARSSARYFSHRLNTIDSMVGVRPARALSP